LEILKTNIKMTEELNLSELFANFVKFISRNSKLLLIIVAIGVVGVIGYQKLKTPYYETRQFANSSLKFNSSVILIFVFKISKMIHYKSL
jgi:predicted negative regulator of RcsB-dependent stress response